MYSNVKIEELLRDFKVCYDKFIIHACVVPIKNITSLLDNAQLLEIGDYILSGTRIMLTSTCKIKMSGRYLLNLRDGIYGVYIVNPLGNCEIKLTWELHGINAKFKVSENEVVIIIVKLMRNTTRRPINVAMPRIAKSMGFRVKVLINDGDLTIYLLNDSHLLSNGLRWQCIDELTIGNWNILLNPCMLVSSPLGFPQVGFIIRGSGEVHVRRYYPNLGKWYDTHNLAIKDGEAYLLSIKL